MRIISQLFAFISIILLMSSSAVAKEINLYDQPKDGAKVVGTIDVAKGVVPIFSPTGDKTWMKVGDPSNGNVGWIKSSDMSNGQGTPATFTFQYGNTPPKDSQEYIQRMTQDITKGFENMYKQQQQVILQMMPPKAAQPVTPTK